MWGTLPEATARLLRDQWVRVGEAAATLSETANPSLPFEVVPQPVGVHPQGGGITPVGYVDGPALCVVPRWSEGISLRWRQHPKGRGGTPSNPTLSATKTPELDGTLK